MTDERLADIRVWQQSARMPGITYPGNPVRPAQPWVSRGADYIDELLGELVGLRAAGDALAAAAGFVANRGRSEGWRGKMIDRLDSALIAWAAARGEGSDAGEDGARDDATQSARGDDR